MTVKEFNKKYAQYLEEGHYGLDIDDANVIQYLDFLFSNVLIQIEGFKYSQIKLKYGFARFYCNSLEPIANDIVEATINFMLDMVSCDSSAF